MLSFRTTLWPSPTAQIKEQRKVWHHAAVLHKQRVLHSKPAINAQLCRARHKGLKARSVSV
jgi:hypothetical protein